MTALWNTAMLAAYAAELSRVNGLVVNEVKVVTAQQGNDLRDLWKANASATAGQHGVHYPNSIQARMSGPLTAQIEPDASMPQGGMSFEFGSRNQPPHLDGQRAMNTIEPTYISEIEKAAEKALSR